MTDTRSASFCSSFPTFLATCSNFPAFPAMNDSPARHGAILYERAPRLRYSDSMTRIDVKETYSDVKVNVGCGLSLTSGGLNFDNSFSVRVARWPIIPSALTRMGFLAAKPAELAEMAQRGSVRFANATRIPCATGSVAAVYSSHMIEHLDRAEARAFLA